MAIGKIGKWTVGVASVVIVVAIGFRFPESIRAQQPPPNPGNIEVRALPSAGSPPPDATPGFSNTLTPEMERALPKIEEIKPLPEPAIADDPPPHEGSMIDLPYTIQPPDIINVEILEALPGRPISGERLVRPDGTITMGFYGDIHVRGLSLDQAKIKVILHMRKYLDDEVLGLLGQSMDEEPGGNVPVPVRPVAPPERAPEPAKKAIPSLPESTNPFEITPKSSATPHIGPGVRPGVRATGRGTRPAVSLTRLAQAPKAPVPNPMPQGKGQADGARPGAAAGNPGGKPLSLKDSNGRIFIPPLDSDRVFVDVASYNSRVFYVLGDVTAPGRLPCTGQETVLDAIQYAGGLVDSADPNAIRLVRPARGGKPSRAFSIDLEAIRDRGEAKANLQILPGDRLIVGRRATVATTVRRNEKAAASLVALNHLLTYAVTMKAVAGLEAMNIDPEKRKEMLKAWAELFADDPIMKEELMKLVK